MGYWAKPEVLEAHAKKRRAKYASDPTYAEKERKRARQRYQSTKPKAENPARKALALIDAAPRDTYMGRELAIMMGLRADYINRQINKGMWPDPKSGISPTFTLAQARRLLTVFAGHLDEVSTYRGDHTETRDRLLAAYKEG
jgi:hypothetical protein